MHFILSAFIQSHIQRKIIKYVFKNIQIYSSPFQVHSSRFQKIQLDIKSNLLQLKLQQSAIDFLKLIDFGNFKH